MKDPFPSQRRGTPPVTETNIFGSGGHLNPVKDVADSPEPSGASLAGYPETCVLLLHRIEFQGISTVARKIKKKIKTL